MCKNIQSHLNVKDKTKIFINVKKFLKTPSGYQNWQDGNKAFFCILHVGCVEEHTRCLQYFCCHEGLKCAKP